MRKVRARAEYIGRCRWFTPNRKYRKWYKRHTSKVRRRMERAGMEPMKTRSVCKGYFD